MRVNASRITVKQAAEILGTSQQFVRIGMQRNFLPIGVALKMSSMYTYHISPKLFYEYVGYVNDNGSNDYPTCNE